MKHSLTLSPILLTLAACSGGASSTLAPFVKFSQIGTNRTVTIENGISNEADYTYNETSRTVTGLSNLSQGQNGATVAVSYDSSRNLGTVTLTTAGGTQISWNTATDTFGTLLINSNIDVAVSANGQNYILLANAPNLGWEYQSFGTWTTGAGTGSGKVGNLSIGSLTTGSAIPTSGTATYTGYAGGRYTDSSARDYFFSSDFTAAANYATRTLTVSTSNSTTTRDLLATAANNDINLSGTMTYAAATNSLSGTFSTADGRLNGTMKGQFYGPAAQELGGSFSAASGTEGILGAFGAKK
jgi:hypothetical protein